MKVVPGCLAALLLIGFATRTPAATDKFNITPEEHAACDHDAAQLCYASYPDEDKLLTCMKAKRNELTPVCLATLKAGLKRRHIPL